MAGQSILMLLALLAQDKPKDEPKDAERAKRAAIVDEAMAKVPAAKVPAAAPAVVDALNVEVQAVPAPPPMPAGAAPAVQRGVFQRVTVNRRTQRRVTLEPKAAPPAKAADDEDNPQPAVAMMGFNNITDMAISKETFDQWIFTSQLNDESRRVKLETLLEQKVNLAMVSHTLDGAQMLKLRLAGAGDIKRFFDRVDASRVEFEAVRQDYTQGMQILNGLEPLSTDYQVGPFGPDSFFAKTLERIGGAGAKP